MIFISVLIRVTDNKMMISYITRTKMLISSSDEELVKYLAVTMALYHTVSLMYVRHSTDVIAHTL